MVTSDGERPESSRDKHKDLIYNKYRFWSIRLTNIHKRQHFLHANRLVVLLWPLRGFGLGMYQEDDSDKKSELTRSKTCSSWRNGSLPQALH